MYRALREGVRKFGIFSGAIQVIAALLLVLGLASHARSALVSGTDGARNWTTDGLTGLNWLNFDQPLGKLRFLAIDELRAWDLLRAELEVGGYLEGWRLATTPEVYTFIQHITGVNYFPVPNSPNSLASHSAIFEGMTDAVASLVGYTFDNEFSINHQRVGGFVAEGTCFVTPPNLCGMASQNAVMLDDPFDYPGMDRYFSGPEQGFAMGMGAWLVRPSATAVPEPTTVALLALGLAGLGFCRRRRAR